MKIIFSADEMQEVVFEEGIISYGGAEFMVPDALSNVVEFVLGQLPCDAGIEMDFQMQGGVACLSVTEKRLCPCTDDEASPTHEPCGEPECEECGVCDECHGQGFYLISYSTGDASLPVSQSAEGI